MSKAKAGSLAHLAYGSVAWRNHNWLWLWFFKWPTTKEALRALPSRIPFFFFIPPHWSLSPSHSDASLSHSLTLGAALYHTYIYLCRRLWLTMFSWLTQLASHQRSTWPTNTYIYSEAQATSLQQPNSCSGNNNNNSNNNNNKSGCNYNYKYNYNYQTYNNKDLGKQEHSLALGCCWHT